MLTLASELRVDAKFVVAKESLLLAGRKLLMIGERRWCVKLPLTPSCLSWGSYIALGLSNILLFVNDDGRKVKQINMDGQIISCHANGSLVAVGVRKDGSNFVVLMKENGKRIWVRETSGPPKGVYVGKEGVAIASGHATIMDLDGKVRWRKWLGSRKVSARSGSYVFDGWKGVVEVRGGRLRVLYPETVKSMDFREGADLYLTTDNTLVLRKGKMLIEAEVEASKAVFWGPRIVVINGSVRIYRPHRSLYELMGVGTKGEELDNYT